MTVLGAQTATSQQPFVHDSKVQWMPLLTGRFAALVALAALNTAILPIPHPWAMVGFFVALIAIAVVDWMLTPSPNAIAVERDAPTMLSLRGSGDITWKVTNSTRRLQWVAFSDDLAPSLRASRRRFRVRVPANASVYADASLTPSRRGRFVLSEVVVRTTGPFGLVSRQGRRQMPADLKVFPPFDSRKQAEMLIEKARVLEVGLRSVRGRGGGTEFEQLREYTVDDDIRRMDWAATVRTGKPIVRTFRAEQNQNIVIMLDTGRVMAGQVGGVARLEHAMDAVMALSTVATRLGDRVGLLAFDNMIRAEVAARHGVSQVARITEAMYQLEPELIESNYRAAFTHAMSRFRRRSLVVLFTELSQHAVSEMLLPALPIVTRNHVLLVASVTDPDVASWARAVPTEADKAFRKAAAVDALAARQRTSSILRSRGATVVDGVPGKLAADVANQYLNIKATGRL
jgi:uncharacterized protein (DUF58 family)